MPATQTEIIERQRLRYIELQKENAALEQERNDFRAAHKEAFEKMEAMEDELHVETNRSEDLRQELEKEQKSARHWLTEYEESDYHLANREHEIDGLRETLQELCDRWNMRHGKKTPFQGGG